jgi:membrane protease YdiL (CAAX protease family)
MVMESMGKKYYVTIYGLIACGILYYIEQYVGVSYAYKASLKVLLFLLIPWFGIRKLEDTSTKVLLGLDHMKWRDIKLGVVVGGLAFVSLVGLAFIFVPMIDFVSMREELANKLHVTKTTFVFVGLYITFINSLLEEVFFRGVLLMSYLKKGQRIFGICFSAILFGIYHMAMFQTWFPPVLVALCVVGLILVGVGFNLINMKTKTFVNSWIIHIIADSAIMLIGYKMLYM